MQYIYVYTYTCRYINIYFLMYSSDPFPCVCKGSINSVPEAGGGLRPVDRATVTSTKVLTPTVTRPTDTVTAR